MTLKELVDDFYNKIPGYPKITPQIVFDKLPELWQLMKNKNLAPDIPFGAFQDQVMQTYMVSEMNYRQMMANKPPKKIIKVGVK